MIVPDGIILSLSGKSITIEERNFFKKIKPLGFVVLSRNFNDKNQIIKLIKELKKVSLNKFALIFIDQEGGKVQRCSVSYVLCILYFLICFYMILYGFTRFLPGPIWIGGCSLLVISELIELSYVL